MDTRSQSGGAVLYTSPLGGFNYYPTSAFKRSASLTTSHQPRQRPLHPETTKAEQAAETRRPSPRTPGPLWPRCRASSSPVLSSGGGGGLHSPDPIPVQRSARRSTPQRGDTHSATTAVGSDRPDPSESRKSSPRKPRWVSGAGAVDSGHRSATRTPSPRWQQRELVRRPPWSTSRGPSSGKGPRRFSSSPSRSRSPAGVTPCGTSSPATATPPSVPQEERGGNRSPSLFVESTTRRALAAESLFLTPQGSAGSSGGDGRKGCDTGVCADPHCMHSRQSIAEFIGMQREVRRCRAAMTAQRRQVEELQERLTVAEAALLTKDEEREAALQAKDAQAEAWVHEREKELLGEMARWEQHIVAEVWAEARAMFARAEDGLAAASSTSRSEGMLSGESVCGDAEESQREEQQHNRATGPHALEEGHEEEAPETEAAERTEGRLIADMRRTIFQLEDTLEKERAERLGVLQELRASVEERTQLQTHVRLLSAWKEEQEQAKARRVGGQKRLLSPTPPRPTPSAPTKSASAGEGRSPQTPLQRLLARSAAVVSVSPSPVPSPKSGDGDSPRTPLRTAEEAETQAAERLVTIRRSSTPHRQAPAVPTQDKSSQTDDGSSGGKAFDSGQAQSTNSVGGTRDHGTEPIPESQSVASTPWREASWRDGVAPGSPTAARAEARCRELLRALMDKERHLATISAERTFYRNQLNEWSALGGEEEEHRK